MKMFRDAFRGIVLGVRIERNIRVQALLATVAIVIGVLLQLNVGIILLVISSVLSSEMLNTCVEAICDLVHPDKSEKIKNIKDIAAGAVLINVVMSVLVGVCLILSEFTGR